MHPVFASAAGLAGRFLRWWRAELLASIPEPLRRRLVARRLVALTIGEHDVTVTGIAADGARIARGDGAALRRLLRPWDRFALRLSPDQVLRLRLDLPAAAEGALDQVVAFELERRTPFRSDEVHVIHLARGRTPGGDRAMVDVAMVPRAVLQGLLAEAHRLGVSPVRIEAPDGGRLPLLQPGRRTRLQRAGAVALAVMLAAVAAAAILVPLHERRSAAARLEAEADQARRTAAKVAGLQQEFERNLQREALLFEMKARFPPAARIIEELSQVLPDDTWLIQLEIADREVRLTGFSAAASQLVALLEASPLFRDVEFRSPVTQDQRTGRERFHIAVLTEASKR